jgi:Domain of unknown function (DUF5666)
MKMINRSLASFAATGIAATLMLTACGGGSDGGSVSTATSTGTITSTSDTAVGAISGFGSIIVNGVRYDDSSAKIIDDNGVSRSSNSLGLGMMVELKGTLRDDGTGSASDINLFSELQGPISNLNVAAGTFTVHGLSVTVSASTVFQDTSGLAALANGNIVEVYGLRDAASISASRIEKKNLITDATIVKLRGQISAVNTIAKTFAIGSTTVNFSNAVITPNAAALVDGAFIKLSSTTAAVSNTITANRIQVLGNRQFNLENGAKSEIQGLVSNFTSINQFMVSGIVVNAATATFVRGNAAAIANGARIEVKGSYANNVLTARLVKFEDGAGVDEFRLFGTVSNFTSLSNFVVRGVTVDASAVGVLFERGTAAQVANGSALELEGSLTTGATGPVLKASKVKFENSPGVGIPTTAGAELEFKGTIASITGDTLVIGARTVKIVAATVFRRITRAQIVGGSFVEIKGVLQPDGTVTAARISLED